MLIAAVPFTGVAALEAFGSYLDDRRRAFGGLQALLWVAALALLVVSSAARSPATEMHRVPPLGASALTALLAVYAVKALIGLTVRAARAAARQAVGAVRREFPTAPRALAGRGGQDAQAADISRRTRGKEA